MNNGNTTLIYNIDHIPKEIVMTAFFKAMKD